MSTTRVRCPKCGSELHPDEKGRAYCVMCGRMYYVCLECLKSGKKDPVEFVFTSQKALAGHMRSHRARSDAERTLSVLKTLNVSLAFGDGNAQRTLSEIETLIERLASLPPRDLQLLNTALLLLVLNLLTQHPHAPPKQETPQPPQTPATEELSDLPSFVQGNPWIGVLSRRS